MDDPAAADSDCPSASLLSSSSTANMTRSDGLTRTGVLRAYYLGAVVCLSGFLYGYDSGVMGGVLTLASFEKDYRYTSKQSTRTSSLAVSLQQLGAFVACFAIWPVTHRYGRRPAIAVASLVFCIGALLQTINTHHIEVFYVARVIAGLGLGASTVVVPMFSSEMSPRQLRGQIGSFYQLFYTFGVFTAYWVDYGVEKDFAAETRQWQIPVGLQLIPAALLGLAMFTLKESVRWLTIHGRHDEAWASLRWIRASDSPAVEAEMDDIRSAVAHEKVVREGFRMTELVTVPDNLKRVIAAATIFCAQQSTGATAFAVYGPQYFKLLVGSSGTRDLLLTAIFGAIKVAACGTFVIFVAERVSRRWILTFGAFFMAACQLTTAAVVKTHPATDGKVTSSGIATIAMIYLFVIAYNFSWGPLPWPYVSEIFPTRIREPGIGVGVASQWLFAFVYTLATPYMIKELAWGTFLFWGIADLVIAIGAWTLMIETRGRSLEEITGEAVVPGDKLRDDEVEHVATL